MSARLRLIGLAALGIAQLAAAGWSIARYEATLSSGTEYRIRVAPVDPADAFRGRYVAVRPTIRIAKPIPPETERILWGSQTQAGKAYVVLESDADGFARARQVVAQAPTHGNYLTIANVATAWSPNPAQPGRAEALGYDLSFPFDRYYMNEVAAPAASQKYVEAVRRTAGSRAWLTVHVKNGIGVIDGLFIDGVPIEQIANAPNQ
jgi:uncharacterized membrane-anchored protein